MTTAGPLPFAPCAELRALEAEALAGGAIALYRGDLEEHRFAPGQDDSAYMGPVALLAVPRSAALYHSEPFGPLDTIVVVDRLEELVAEMNVSNGALVATIASDDPDTAALVGSQLRAFKVGVNEPRSRGDRDEPFGGLGESWTGCFVGGPSRHPSRV